jgi:hypothetical protein
MDKYTIRESFSCLPHWTESWRVFWLPCKRWNRRFLLERTQGSSSTGCSFGRRSSSRDRRCPRLALGRQQHGRRWQLAAESCARKLSKVGGGDVALAKVRSSAARRGEATARLAPGWRGQAGRQGGARGRRTARRRGRRNGRRASSGKWRRCTGSGHLRKDTARMRCHHGRAEDAASTRAHPATAAYGDGNGGGAAPATKRQQWRRGAVRNGGLAGFGQCLGIRRRLRAWRRGRHGRRVGGVWRVGPGAKKDGYRLMVPARKEFSRI